MSFVAGAQGNAFHKTRGMLYGNVAVTFVVQMAFNFLAQSLFEKEGVDGEPNVVWAGTFFLEFRSVSRRAGPSASSSTSASSTMPRCSSPQPSCSELAVRAMAQPEFVDPTPGGLIG